MDIVTAEEFEKRLAAICGSRAGSAFPRKQRDRHILLRSIAQTLDASRSHTEQSVNEALQGWLSDVAGGLEVDHVALRRYLVDDGYLRRDAAGAAYMVQLEAHGDVVFDDAVAGLDASMIVHSARERSAARKREHSDTRS